MRVYIEQTTQKNIMKFVSDEILTSGSVEFNPNDDFSKSPFAAQLFQFPFVEQVFITANFVAIKKSEIVEWEDIAQEIKEVVNAFLENNGILLNEKTNMPYTLYAEMTPNPLVMKFVSNQLITPKMAEIRNREANENAPVAKAVFEAFPYIQEVFVSENYFSLTKDLSIEWQEVALEIRQFLLEYLQSGKEVVNENFKQKSFHEHELLHERNFNSVEKEIEKILEEYIQPAVAGDGGNIALIEFDENSKTAKMLLQGACSGCPSSTMTLKNGIESILKEMMPNVVEHVEAING